MITFILNEKKVVSHKPGGTSLLDIIRKEYHLPGTKSGCREGDCGACTVLEGILIDGAMHYKTIVSCLTPLASIHGKHIVTIEGLNLDKLSPVQQAFSDHAATQCGFCTPGFVVSLTGFLMSNSNDDPIQAISGNICRCTGYKSIEKAAFEIRRLKKLLPLGEEIKYMTRQAWIPAYFNEIPELLNQIAAIPPGEGDGVKVAGGTDLMVQQPGRIRKQKLESFDSILSKEIKFEKEFLQIGGAVSIQEFFRHHRVLQSYPQLQNFSYLIASEQIRNMGTLAGNIVNASPIGDLSILFLSLNAQLQLENHSGAERIILLRDFFIDYKQTALSKNEWIKNILIKIPHTGRQIHFEKVSKRTHLDIASVNSAIAARVDEKYIREISLSFGGVAAIPKFMARTSAFLTGKELSINTLGKALEIMQDEISPISDIRGSAQYKRLLARQLFLQHFLVLYPELISEEAVIDLLNTKIMGV